MENFVGNFYFFLVEESLFYSLQWNSSQDGIFLFIAVKFMSRWRFVRGWLWPKFYRKFNWELVVCLDEVLKSMSLIHVKIAHHSRYGCSSVFFRNLIARRLHHECPSNRAISLNANSLLEHWCYSGKIYLRFWQGLHFSSTWNTPLFVMLIILGFHFMLDSFLYCIYEWPSWKNHHTHFVILHICYDEFSSFALCFFFFSSWVFT